MTNQTQPHTRWLTVMAVGAIFVVVYFAAGRLRFEPLRDETHFWPTSLRFAQQIPPDPELLRTYNELNTPLPFVLWGGIERAFGAGIAAGRLCNLLISMAIAMSIVLANRGPPLRGVFVCIGLLAFPYFLGSSVMLYTDIIAAAFVLCGCMFHLRGWPWVGMVMFALAIASRQYMVAFPLAISVNELWLRIQRQRAGERSVQSRAAWIAPLLSAMTLGGWFIFFGGPAPRSAIEAQHLATAQAGRFFPDHSLYVLACIGAWFVIPEAVLFRTISPIRIAMRSPLAWILGGVIVAGFILWPPLRNVDYGIESMGYLDKAARAVLPDPLRMAMLAMLAVLAAIRFSRVNLAFFLLWMNALIMLKAHIGWDKYVLPLLVVFWWLESRCELDASCSGERLCSDRRGLVDDSHRVPAVV